VPEDFDGKLDQLGKSFKKHASKLTAEINKLRASLKKAKAKATPKKKRRTK